jgi:hypothetical protein
MRWHCPAKMKYAVAISLQIRRDLHDDPPGSGPLLVVVCCSKENPEIVKTKNLLINQRVMSGAEEMQGRVFSCFLIAEHFS